MAMHNTNSLLKYVVPVVLILIVIALISSFFDRSSERGEQNHSQQETSVKNTADHDSAAESLETLTAELAETKQQITEVSKNNEVLKKNNTELLSKLGTKQGEETSQLSNEIKQLKDQVQTIIKQKSSDYPINGASSNQAITVVTDLSQPMPDKTHTMMNLVGNYSNSELHPATDKDTTGGDEKIKSIPYYTIPANATSVKDKLMTALVGRIPVKGIVTDPYPFKIVVSDDNLAANGLRIPHLLQMIVSGYCEGDLNLMSVRGWITSLTFVFDDGTISTTTSNDNDIGNFTKANSLGYLSDQYGNPFISGKLITNAPAYLGGNLALGMATGAANAYATAQTTTNSSAIGGTSTTSVTGSQARFVGGQALAGGMTEAQQWWHDREQQSFDAIYVPTVDEKGQSIQIAINFAKEIHIDYNPKGRKLSYAHDFGPRVHHDLD